MDKTLILIRHAHRDTDNPAQDNGLSDKGRKQVKQMLQFAGGHFDPKNILKYANFLSSPKKRCVETIMPLAEEFGAKVKIEPAIGEGCTEAKLEAFIESWKRDGAALTVACSHGDVIPMLVEKLVGTMIGIRKCGWCQIEMVDGICQITWLVQRYE